MATGLLDSTEVGRPPAVARSHRHWLGRVLRRGLVAVLALLALALGVG